MTRTKMQGFGATTQRYALELRYTRNAHKDGVLTKEVVEKKTELTIESFR